MATPTSSRPSVDITPPSTAATIDSHTYPKNTSPKLSPYANQSQRRHHSTSSSPYPSLNSPSHKQVLMIPESHAAKQLEYDTLMKNNTWTLVPPASHRQPIGCK